MSVGCCFKYPYVAEILGYNAVFEKSRLDDVSLASTDLAWIANRTRVVGIRRYAGLYPEW